MHVACHVLHIFAAGPIWAFLRSILLYNIVCKKVTCIIHMLPFYTLALILQRDTYCLMSAHLRTFFLKPGHYGLDNNETAAYCVDMANNTHYIAINTVDSETLELFPLVGLGTLEGVLNNIFLAISLSLIKFTCTLFEINLGAFSAINPVLPLTLINPTLWHFFDSNFFVDDHTWQLEAWHCNEHGAPVFTGIAPAKTFSGSWWRYKRRAHVWEHEDYSYDYRQGEQALSDGSGIGYSFTTPEYSLWGGFPFQIRYEPPDPGYRKRIIPDEFIRYHVAGGASLGSFVNIEWLSELPGAYYLYARELSSVTSDYNGDALWNLPPAISNYLDVLSGGLGYNRYYIVTLEGHGMANESETSRNTNTPGNTKGIPGILPVGMILATMLSQGVMSNFGIRIRDDRD
jgi:hypothetical protein